MFAHCTYCPMQISDESVDVVETWAYNHELQGDKHSVKVEGYENAAE